MTYPLDGGTTDAKQDKLSQVKVLSVVPLSTFKMIDSPGNAIIGPKQT